MGKTQSDRADSGEEKSISEKRKSEVRSWEIWNGKQIENAALCIYCSLRWGRFSWSVTIILSVGTEWIAQCVNGITTINVDQKDPSVHLTDPSCGNTKYLSKYKIKLLFFLLSDPGDFQFLIILSVTLILNFLFPRFMPVPLFQINWMCGLGVLAMLNCPLGCIGQRA